MEDLNRCFSLVTCGGGRPPAPSGHTGSMVSFLGVLHWQAGDGLRKVHFMPASISIKAGLTKGISHSVVMLLQGKSLPEGEIRQYYQTKQLKEKKNVWWILTPKVHPPCSVCQTQACPATPLQSTSSEHLWDAHYCIGWMDKIKSKVL